MGFGLLFYGLRIMGDSLSMLKDMPEFIAFAEMMGRQPLLALLAGTVLTVLIQGSAATIGVVQVSGSGAMSMSAALPFVFGSNIGTTITGVFAAIGGSLAAKRTAGLHTLFNVIRHPDRHASASAVHPADPKAVGDAEHRADDADRCRTYPV